MEASGFDLSNPEKVCLSETTKVNFNVKCAMMDENNNSKYIVCCMFLTKSNKTTLNKYFETKLTLSEKTKKIIFIECQNCKSYYQSNIILKQ